jgi:hypothetical protein
MNASCDAGGARRHEFQGRQALGLSQQEIAPTCAPLSSGNLLFNTLGNLEVDARAGLLFVDPQRHDLRAQQRVQVLDGLEHFHQAPHGLTKRLQAMFPLLKDQVKQYEWEMPRSFRAST